MLSNPDAIWLIAGVLMLGPFLLLVAAALIFLWARSWRGRSERAAKTTQAQIGQAEMLLLQLGSLRDEYAAVERAPYARMVEELDRTVAGLDASIGQMEVLLDALEQVRQDAPAGGWAAVQGFWQSTGERRRLCIQLDHAQKTLQDQMEVAQVGMQKLEMHPLETSQRIQAAREKIARLEQVLSELHGLGLGGLEDAFEALKQVREMSLKIPVDFRENASLPRAALFELTSSVIEILDELEPPLETWLREAAAWSDQHRLGSGTFQRILTNLANLRAVTSAAPPLLLDISSFIIHLGQLEERVRAQFEMFQSSTVQELGRHVRAASRFENTLRASSEEHDRACLEALDLERKQLELETRYSALESRLAGNRGDNYAFVRDQSRERLSMLETRMDRLRPFEAKLLPGEIAERTSLAVELLANLQTLDGEMKERKERFDELVGLLQSSDFQSGPAWLAATREGIRAAQATDGDARDKSWNWRSKTDSLVRSLEGLEALQARVLPSSLPVSIAESELDGRLEQARRLAGLHAKIRPQAAQILRAKPTPSA